MKATGIVRRIDDLGRVVIPKEIRRSMRIREGDPLEIYTDSDGEVIFKKYSPIGELSEFASQYAEVLVKSTEIPVIICDRDHCIAASGVSRKEVLERRVTPELEDVTEARKAYCVRKGDAARIHPLEGVDFSAAVIVPIIASGDVCGSVIFGMPSESYTPTEHDVRLAQIAANFLGKQMEE
jgi:AbrB family transcriptional regulator (stage V sporulation protein T)